MDIYDKFRNFKDIPITNKPPKRKITPKEKIAISNLKIFMAKYQPGRHDAELKIIFKMIIHAIEDLSFACKNRGLVQTSRTIRAELFLLNYNKDFEWWLNVTPWPAGEILKGIAIRVRELQEIREKEWGEDKPIYWDVTNKYLIEK